MEDEIISKKLQVTDDTLPLYLKQNHFQRLYFQNNRKGTGTGPTPKGWAPCRFDQGAKRLRVTVCATLVQQFEIYNTADNGQDELIKDLEWWSPV